MIEKEKQGNIQRAQRYQAFPSEVVYSEPFSEKIDTSLSHLTRSLIYLRWFLVMHTPHVYPTLVPNLDQG